MFKLPNQKLFWGNNSPALALRSGNGLNNSINDYAEAARFISGSFFYK